MKPRESCAVDRENTKKAAKVWVAMSMSFGRRWETQYGSVESKEFWFWAKALRDYSVEQVKLGIEKCLVQAEKTAGKGETPFPPDLFVFKSFCSEPVVHPSHRLFLPGPDNSKLRIKGKKRLLALREQLKQ